MDTRSGLPWLGYGNDGKELPQRECESGQAGQPHRAWGGWQLPRAHRGYCVAATAHDLPLNRTFIFFLWRWQEEPGPGVSPVKGWGGQRPYGSADSSCSCLSCWAHSPKPLPPPVPLAAGNQCLDPRGCRLQGLEEERT